MLLFRRNISPHNNDLYTLINKERDSKFLISLSDLTTKNTYLTLFIVIVIKMNVNYFY